MLFPPPYQPPLLLLEAAAEEEEEEEEPPLFLMGSSGEGEGKEKSLVSGKKERKKKGLLKFANPAGTVFLLSFFSLSLPFSLLPSTHHQLFPRQPLFQPLFQPLLYPFQPQSILRLAGERERKRKRKEEGRGG